MLLLTLLGFLVIFVGLMGATEAGARLAMRLLDVRDFRWLDSEPAHAAKWRRFAVRLVSALATLGVCIALFFCCYFFDGIQVPTTTVRVNDGPAREAGMLSGDRIVSIDGVKIDSWESARVQVQAGRDHQIEVQRGGTTEMLHVTPDARRHIGVSPRARTEALGFVESARRSAVQPFLIVRDTLRYAADSVREKGPGPVTVVTESASHSERKLWSVVWPFAFYASYFWLFLASFQVLDAATLWLFRKTHPSANRSEPFWRLARLQQALVLALASLLMCVVWATVDALLPWRSVTGLAILLLLPACFALVPLTWVAANHFWGVARSSLAVTAAVLVPCAVVFMAVLLLLRVRRELRERAGQVGVFVERTS